MYEASTMDGALWHWNPPHDNPLDISEFIKGVVERGGLDKPTPGKDPVLFVDVIGKHQTPDGGILRLQRHKTEPGAIVIDHIRHGVIPNEIARGPGNSVQHTTLPRDNVKQSKPLVWRDSKQRAFAAKVAAGLRAAGLKVQFSDYLKQATASSAFGLPEDDFNPPTPPGLIEILRATARLDKIEELRQRRRETKFRRELPTSLSSEKKRLLTTLENIENFVGHPPFSELPPLRRPASPREFKVRDEFVDTRKRERGMGRARQASLF